MAVNSVNQVKSRRLATVATKAGAPDPHPRGRRDRVVYNRLGYLKTEQVKDGRRSRRLSRDDLIVALIASGLTRHDAISTLDRIGAF